MNILSSDFGQVNGIFETGKEIGHLNDLFFNSQWSAYQNIPYESVPSRFEIDQVIINVGGQPIAFKKAQFSKMEGPWQKGWLLSLVEGNEIQNLIEVMFASNTDFMFILDANGSILKYNEAVKAKLHYDDCELIGKSILQLHPPVYREEAALIVAEMIQGIAKICTIPLRTKNGVEIPVETLVSRTAWNGKEVLFGISRDVSERTDALMQLLIAQEKYKISFYNSAKAMAIIELETKAFVEINQQYRKLFHKKSDGGVSKSVRASVVSEWLDDAEFSQRLIQTGVASKVFKLALSSRRSVSHFIQVEAEVFNAGNMRYAMIIAEDITQKHVNEILLRESENRMKLILEGADVGLWEWHRNPERVKANKQFGKMLGYNRLHDNDAEAFFRNNIHADDKGRLMEQVHNHLKGNASGFTCEFRILHKSGKWLWFESKGKVFEYSTDGTPIRLAGIVINIQKKKEFEEAILFKQKFESILGNITLSLINISHTEVDRHINTSLHLVAETIGAEFSGIAAMNPQGRFFQITHSGEFPETIQSNVNANPGLRLPRADWLGRLKSQEVLFLNDIDELQAFKNIFTGIPDNFIIRSAILIPMVYKKTIDGIIVFCSKAAWSDKVQQSESYFKVLGLAFINAIQRKWFKIKIFEYQQLLEFRVKEHTNELNKLNIKLQKIVAQLAIKNNEIQRFKIIADTADYAVIITGPDLEPLYFNKCFTRLFGSPVNRILKDLMCNLTSEFILPDLQANIDRLFLSTDSQHYETVLQSKKSGKLPVIVNTVVIRDSSGMPGYIGFTIIDLSHQKQIENERRNSELKFRTLYNVANDANIITDEHANILDVNPATTELLGYSRSELLSLNITEIETQSVSMTVKERLAVILKFRKSFFLTEMVTRNKDVIPVEINLSAFELNGKMFLLNHIRDLRERRQKEIELRLLWKAVENSDNGIVITDAARQITYVNPVYCVQSGYTAQELIGKKPSVLSAGKHEPEFYKKLTGTTREGNVWKGRLINKRKDGMEFMIDSIISPILDRQGNVEHYVSITRDITHEAQQELRMLQTEKLKAIGTLAGGIAHDFNNLLQIILSYNELIEYKSKGVVDVENYILTIAETCRRGSRLVSDLLSFSREKDIDLQVCDFAEVIGNAINMIKPGYPSTLQFKCQLTDSAQVLCDPQQIMQMLLNLFNNASYAMQGHGEIKVRVQSIMATNGISKVQLEVTDTGCGMDQLTMNRIYEPFYTTKPPGQGTGLGIPIVHRIVQRHGANLNIESKENTGTTVRILFPQKN
jgi:PAS domain S-box-containing protein